jgi:parvulin-like peptidyl-prolyl isomerase
VAAERIAESALDRLRSGRPFSEVARQFSTDPESKASGGDLGTVALSSLPAPMRKAVEDTPAGEVSDPVEGPGGWYLFKATDVQPARTAPFPEVEDQIIGELTRRERFDALEDWLDAAPRRRTSRPDAFGAAGRALPYSAATETTGGPVRNALIMLAVVALLILVVGR